MRSHDFSMHARKSMLHRLKTERFDLIVIGGGITGAGIALDASSRGLKTVLVEKNDFASGTSSRSTKLIHGGLRYLKQLEFGLVKEVGSERAVVHNIARHLVVPEKMLLPLSEKRGLGYWLTSIGLRIYDYLAGVKPEDQRTMLTRTQTLKKEPLLRKDDIKGGALYAEYRTDDARLTIEIMKSAAAYGALILNYLAVTSFQYENNLLTGVALRDQLNEDSFLLNAKVIVNAAGPWVDELRTLNASKTGKQLHLTKGVHVVVPHHKLPVQQAIYFDVNDARMIFAIPRGRVTYIGTTDTNYHESIDRVITTREDAQYLIDAVNFTFPEVKLSIDDIESSWAGLRPLIHEEGKSASELSRKDEIFESTSGLISIAGGKLTGYRKMAERVVNLVIKKYFYEKDLRQCFTQSIHLSGASFASYNDVKKYIEEVSNELRQFNLPEVEAKNLVHLFGKQSKDIISYMKAEPLSRHTSEARLLLAMLHYTIAHEMVATLADFFIRRTGLLYFDIRKVSHYKEIIADECQRILLWDDARKTTELNNLHQSIKEVISFKS